MQTKKIKIKDLKTGMKIKSYNPEKGCIEFKTVECVWDTKVKPENQVHLIFENGTELHCSDNHPIMVFDGVGVIERKPFELSKHDFIITDIDGKFTKLLSCKIDEVGDTGYIDITVGGTNTFFTQDSLESPMVLTHNSQGGVRNGAATIHCPLWHWEIEDILVLKNNEGTFDNRVRRLDYSIQLNGYLYQKLLEDGDITLFSTEDVPDLYEAFFTDQKKFAELYEKYDRKTSIRKRRIPAYQLFSKLNTERTKTGRLYIMNVDHCNTHSSFLENVAGVYMSNLCQEITLPTKPLDRPNGDGEIALCTLSAINMIDLDPDVDDFHQKMEERCYMAVAGLDWLLDHQEYPLEAAEIPNKARRNLGIGVINYAYFLTKRGFKYSDDKANEITHRWFEAFQFYLIKASVELAKQKGRCDLFHETKYSKGILPIDTYKKELDEIAPFKLECDWEWLREEILTHGMRNSTLSALMPSETSSQVSNATNGIEPPREPIVVKESEDGNLKQVVPEFYHLKNKYEYEFDMPSPQGYLDKVCIIQKFIDQSISANTSYNKKHYGGKIPEQAKLDDIIRFWYYGGKTLYYDNTPTFKTEDSEEIEDIQMDDIDDDCPDGVCKI